MASLSQDCTHRLSQVIGERTGHLQELRKQLSSRERELCELRRDKERQTGGETERLQSLLKEKEAFINVPAHIFTSLVSPALLPFPFTVHLILTICLIHQELMQGQEEAMEPTSKEREDEIKAIQEELQLVLKKEMEAQVSVILSCGDRLRLTILNIFSQ